MEQFPQFDVVSDHSDHAFSGSKPDLLPMARNAVMKEWQILKNSLPKGIHVRVYSGRVDLLRAVIIGPPKTPYHDGLFFFDFKFSKKYPNKPPKAHYHSFGLGLKPNLSAKGLVRMALRNTCPGPSEARWRPEISTVLQVLVSIHGLVLTEPPYNNMAYSLSCKTMLYLLNRLPKNFETFVAQHFRARSRAILTACQAYLNGLAQVGSFEYRADNNASPFDLDRIKNGGRLCWIINLIHVKSKAQI